MEDKCKVSNDILLPQSITYKKQKPRSTKLDIVREPASVGHKFPSRRQNTFCNDQIVQPPTRKGQFSSNLWGLTERPKEYDNTKQTTHFVEQCLCGCLSDDKDKGSSSYIPKVGRQQSINKAILHSLKCKVAYKTPVRSSSDDNYTILNHHWKMFMANFEVIMSKLALALQPIRFMISTYLMQFSLAGKRGYL